MSPELTDLGRVLVDGVSSGAFPGAVAIVASSTEVLASAAAGTHNLATAEPMTTTSIFRIASMTKLATTTALLQLLERGDLHLDSPVGDILPSFDGLLVLDGFDGDTPILRPPATRATVRNLLSHTSGLAYPVWNAKLQRYHQLTGVPMLGSGELSSFDMPLVCDPGSEFNYGMSMDWAGRLIEAVTGLSLPRYLDQSVFGPLAMTDTVFVRSADQLAHSGAVHVHGPDGSWLPIAAIDYYLPGVDEPQFFAGGHALYSSPASFMRLQQAILAGGSLDGVQILEPATIDAMFVNQLGRLDVGIIATTDQSASPDIDLRGMGWGLGIMLNDGDGPIGLPPHTGGWAGGFNTFYWIDRERDLTAALYTQTLPFWDPPIMSVLAEFEAALYPDRPARVI